MTGMTELDDGDPSWVKNAQRQAVAENNGDKSLTDLLSQPGVEGLANDTSVETFGGSPSLDEFPQEVQKSAMPQMAGTVSVGNKDASTMIMEQLFKNGIPVGDIKKAMLVSSIVDGLQAYVAGDPQGLQTIVAHITQQK